MDDNLSKLISHWHTLKQFQDHYTAERLKLEKGIQRHLCEANKWNLNGTMSLGELKIRTALKRKWNNDRLTEIKESNQVAHNKFPFQIEYKEIKSHSEYLEKNEGQLWAVFRPALTVYPSKPYFFSAKKEG